MYASADLSSYLFSDIPITNSQMHQLRKLGVGRYLRSIGSNSSTKIFRRKSIHPPSRTQIRSTKLVSTLTRRRRSSSTIGTIPTAMGREHILCSRSLGTPGPVLEHFADSISKITIGRKNTSSSSTVHSRILRSRTVPMANESSVSRNTSAKSSIYIFGTTASRRSTTSAGVHY